MNEENFNFQFTQKDTPVIRKQIIKDLKRIIKYVKKEAPKSTVGLWGSFAYGEGRVSVIKGKIIYSSDFDIVIVTNSFLDYFKVLRNKKLKNIEKELGLKISIIITNEFRIKKRDTSVRIEKLPARPIVTSLLIEYTV
ncbi:hypothetical protein ACFLTH_18090, partial [Bacteroidota bacterium]